MSGHGAHADPNDPFQKRVAITMAMFTVGLAFTNALVSDARSSSILKANDAAAKWSHYQSKSIKQNMKQLEISLVERLSAPGKAPVSFDKEQAEITRYDGEKAAIEHEARDLETAQKRDEHREHRLEYAAIGFELGIVIAGVGLLQHSKLLFRASLACAAAGVAIVVYAMLLAH